MIEAFDNSTDIMGTSQYMVIFMLIWVLKLTEATRSWSNTELAEGEQLDGVARSRLRRHTCRETEYPDNDICCLKCPAGTHVQSSCTRAGEEATCEDCDFGTYTEHENGLLKQCLKCTNCRSDQYVVRPCTTIQNTECQCKPGTFCAPDQACEICKKCSRCREGEVNVRNCTATANAVCKKPLSSPSTGSVAVIIISLAVLVAVVLLVGLVCLWKRRTHQTETDSQSDRNESMKVVVDKMTPVPSTEESQNRQNHAMTREDDRLCLLPQQCQRVVRAAATGKPSAMEEDEDTGLGDSLANTASNSQSSLLSNQLPTPAPPCSTYYLPLFSPQPSSMVPTQLSMREDDPIPSLIPLNGEESLKKCFEYFEDLDVDFHKRFFRHLGINDNLIKSKDHLHHEDRIHELLNVWMEKVGKEASLNHLLKALLTFNQRLTAENVIAKAIANGNYVRERE